MRVLGRWMRMLTIPNQSSVAKAYQEFDEDGRMKPSPYYDRIVDVVEELVVHPAHARRGPYLVDRYSERKETAAALSRRMRRRPSELPGTCRAAGGYAFPARSTRISLQMHGS